MNKIIEKKNNQIKRMEQRRKRQVWGIEERITIMPKYCNNYEAK